MFTGSLANQGGYSLGINAATNVTYRRTVIHAEREKRDNVDGRRYGQLAEGDPQHRLRR